MPRAAHQDRTPPTFTFRNIGPIDNAELELGDLTIIAGCNNTGKTYLVYTLYGFLKTWEGWSGPTVATSRTPASARSRWATLYPAFQQISDQMARSGQAELSVDPDALNRERNTAMNALTRRFSQNGLAAVFSSRPERFESASMGVKLGTEFPQREILPGAEDAPTLRYDGTSLAVDGAQPGNKRLHPLALRRRLWRQYLRFLFPDLPSDPFVLSAERFGISLFYRELDFQRSQLVDLLQKLGDSKRKSKDIDPFLFIDEAVSRYARPVKDNIDYTRSIPDLPKQRSEIHDNGFFNDIKKLMSGYYAVARDGIEFRSIARGDRRFSIPLHLASSSVRGLSDLYFFLRHTARRNHLLIIDEPESHLDTANQIRLARLLAGLVRAGLKILLTTHSDYLIKELNNLIMLSSKFDKRASVMRRLRYTRDDCIPPERIRAYIAKENGLTRCQVDELGIDMPNFDETINKINDVANELAMRLTQQSHD